MRRHWKFVHGWRSNYPAAAAHFAASSMFAKVGDELHTRLESALGIAALDPKWVCVDVAHRWSHERHQHSPNYGNPRPHD